MRADLDQEIDRAVREMLDAEPRPDLRARVLERIVHPHPHTHPLRWVVLPIAAAALLLLFVVAPWRTGQKAAPAVASTSLANIVPAIDAPLSANVNRPAKTLGETRRVARETQALRADPNGPPVTVAVAPLEPLDAIQVPPVALTRLDGQPIAIAPLASIEQIEIQPVAPPEERD